jgi:ankyrin repeat protein
MASAPSLILDALYHGRREEADRLAAHAGSAALSIHEAAALGDVQRIERLLADDPTQVNAWASDGFQPLGLACFFGRREAARLLLDRGGALNTPSRNTQQVMALHAALAGPTPDLASWLIDAGADVNAVQQDGVTPLHEAAAIGNLTLVQLLLARGADASARDAKRRSAADFAREGGHAAIVELLEKG